MIPPSNEHGFLPAGIHYATLVEIEARFGRLSEIRRVQMESVQWMVEFAVRAGVMRIVLNGSFVTDIMEPNDVDCVLLLAADYPRDVEASRELAKGLPFLDIALVDDQGFAHLVEQFYVTDRQGKVKGVVEVLP